MQRTLITIVLIGLGLGLVLMLANKEENGSKPIPENGRTTEPQDAAPPPATSDVPAADGPQPRDTSSDDNRDNGLAATPQPESVEPPLPDPGLLTVIPGPRRTAEEYGDQVDPVIGAALDQPGDYPLQAKLTIIGAGVMHVDLVNYFKEIDKKEHYRIQERFLASDEDRIYPMGVRSVEINGKWINLAGALWTVDQHETDRVVMSITIARQEDNSPLLKITRTYRVAPGRYDLQLEQELTNLTDDPLTVRLNQFAQGDLPMKGGYMGDRRTVLTGYFNPQYDPSRTRTYLEDDAQHTRANVIEDEDFQTIWPNPNSLEQKYELVYAAMSNRYFTVAVHRPIDKRSGEQGETYRARAMQPMFSTLGRHVIGSGEDRLLALTLTSAPRKLAGGASQRIDLEIYAGPKKKEVLADDPVYTALGLEQLIIYNIGGCCSYLTFQWLAKFLLAFLALLYAGLADWGVAIIILVIVVRLLLHPLTKKSQLQMMKVGKQMASLKPEMEKLKKKYKDNQSKLNQEMMQLYREKGVNPAAMGLGCLPMFLQMPIWIALYAMLYFAIELRHESALYGLFQMFGDWKFMADLSSADRFIPLGKAAFTIPLVGWHIDSINLLPMLMGVVFYFQQKYMAQPQAEMSEQQAQQQKIMKVMMIFLFPVMLYKAPCGLTLYILASTFGGIIDSKLVRKELKRLEDSGELFKKKTPKQGGFMDRLQKAAEAKQREMQQKQQGPKKRRK